LLGLTLPARAAGENLAARVILLANRDDADSRRVAQHYAEARGVPAANVVALPMSRDETISWRDFVATIWTPLLDQLVRDNWIDAIPMALTDPVGRPKYAPHGHRIAALVVCRGVPLKIAHDPALYAEVRPFTTRGEFRTNAGAVDSELSLLATPNYLINAFVPNPLFQNERPTTFELAEVVKVSRLDGPSMSDALALVDHALAAERAGLLGRAYIDLSERDQVGNLWLDLAARQLADLGFDPAIDREAATFPAVARMDAPAIYFGWYAGELNGPFALPGFRFPPGGIAIHINSYTESTLRSATAGWTGPLIARGVTATVGNVNEPYLEFTHRPHLMLRALARGATLADAAYFSVQALSWQAILIGDPLYRPFAVPLEAQLGNAATASPRLASYAVLRKIHLLDIAGQHDEATALARAAMRTTPSLALGFELAQRLRAAGEAEAAANALGFASLLKSFPPDEWALAREVARLLETCGRPTHAVAVWRTLITDALPRDLQTDWLPEAIDAARAAREPSIATMWQAQLDGLAAGKR